MSRELPLGPCIALYPFDGFECTALDGKVTSGTCAACGRLVCESCSTRRNWGPRGRRWRQRVCRACQEQRGVLRKRWPPENPVELTPDLLRGFLKVAEAVEKRGPGLLGQPTEFTERAWVRFGTFTEWAERELRRIGS